MGEGGGREEKGRPSLLFSLPSFPFSPETLDTQAIVPRRLSCDENVRAKEGAKETTGETSGRSCFQDGGPICNF